MTVRYLRHEVNGRTVVVGYEVRIHTCILTDFPCDFEGEFTIPSAVCIDGKQRIVTGISDLAFIGCSGLTRIVVPDSVLFIGKYAFSGCSDLTYAAIPRSVDVSSVAFAD